MRKQHSAKKTAAKPKANLQFRPERAAGTLKGYSILNSAPADFATAFKGLKKVRVPLSRS
jgi:hypothetical protein